MLLETIVWTYGNTTTITIFKKLHQKETDMHSLTHTHTHMYSDTYFHDKEEGWGGEVREEPCKHVNGNLWHFSTINSTWTKRKFSSLKWICYGRVCMYECVCMFEMDESKQKNWKTPETEEKYVFFLSERECVCVYVRVASVSVWVCKVRLFFRFYLSHCKFRFTVYLFPAAKRKIFSTFFFIDEFSFWLWIEI